MQTISTTNMISGDTIIISQPEHPDDLPLNLKNTVKEHQITAKNIAASKVVLKTETAKLTSANKVLTAQNGEKESNLLKVNNVVVNAPPEASIQITVTRTPTISKETTVSP